MKLAIRKHWMDFLAIAGLAILGTAIGIYILGQQNLRFPLVQETPKQIKIELANAQAVQPGQGQTVRVAGVEVGRIADVELEDGIAVVTLDIERDYENLIKSDATALLRPKTALKDMFIEVDPGRGKAVPEGGRISVANSLPDIDPDEVYAALDADTRPYLKLLVAGAGKGLRERGDDLREVFRRFEPIHRDLARVTRASARRRGALKELIHDYGLLMTELGKHPQDLRRLVTASRSVFDALANEDDAISASVAQLPASLRASEQALGEVQEFAPVLRSSLEALRKPIRKLDETNEAVIPFLRETEPVIRDRDPSVRARRAAVDGRPSPRGQGHGAGDAGPAALLRRAEPLLQHRRVQPGRRRGARRQVDLGAAPAPGGLPLLARMGLPERQLAVLERRRPGPMAPRHDLRRPRRRAHRDRERRDRRHRGDQPGARRPADRRDQPRWQQRRRPAAGHAVRLLQLQRPADRAASGQRRRRPDPATPSVPPLLP